MNEESPAALALLSRMRFACGDDGKRMQDELEEYLRELKQDAERYRWLRARWGRLEEIYEGGTDWSGPGSSDKEPRAHTLGD